MSQPYLRLPLEKTLRTLGPERIPPGFPIRGVVDIGGEYRMNFRILGTGKRHEFIPFHVPVTHTLQRRLVSTADGGFILNTHEFWFDAKHPGTVKAKDDLMIRAQPVSQRWHQSLPITGRLRIHGAQDRIRNLTLAKAIEEISAFSEKSRQHFWSTTKSYRYATLLHCKELAVPLQPIRQAGRYQLVFAICERGRTTWEKILRSDWAKDIRGMVKRGAFAFDLPGNPDYTKHPEYDSLVGDANILLMDAVGMAMAGPDEKAFGRHETVESLAEGILKVLLYQRAQSLFHRRPEPPFEALYDIDPDPPEPPYAE